MSGETTDARKRRDERAAESAHLTSDDIAWVKRMRGQEDAIAEANRKAFELFVHPLRCDCPDHDGRGSE